MVKSILSNEMTKDNNLAETAKTKALRKRPSETTNGTSSEKGGQEEEPSTSEMGANKSKYARLPSDTDQLMEKEFNEKNEHATQGEAKPNGTKDLPKSSGQQKRPWSSTRWRIIRRWKIPLSKEESDTRAYWEIELLQPPSASEDESSSISPRSFYVRMAKYDVRERRHIRSSRSVIRADQFIARSKTIEKFFAQMKKQTM